TSTDGNGLTIRESDGRSAARRCQASPTRWRCVVCCAGDRRDERPPPCVVLLMAPVALLLSSILSLAVGPLQTQANADVRVLRSDAAIERELAAGQSHTYRLTLTPEQYAHIVIDQRGVDVTTTAFAPSGRQISIFDTSNTD